MLLGPAWRSPYLLARESVVSLSPSRRGLHTQLSAMYLLQALLAGGGSLRGGEGPLAACPGNRVALARLASSCGTALGETRRGVGFITGVLSSLPEQLGEALPKSSRRCGMGTAWNLKSSAHVIRLLAFT